MFVKPAAKLSARSFKALSDQDIIQIIRSGDESILSHIYKAYYHKVINHLVRKGAEEDTARDIYQEALTVVWQKVSKSSFVLTCHLSTFLFSIAIRQWLKECERRRSQSKYIGRVKDSFLGTYSECYENDVSILDKKDRDDMIAKIFALLPKNYKTILSLVYFEQLTTEEIMQRMNLKNDDVVKTLKYKALTRIRQEIEVSGYKKPLSLYYKEMLAA